MARIASISMTEEKNIKTNKVRTVGLKTEKCVAYSCLRHTMRLGRWFGFFPVEGLDSESIIYLRFKVRSWYGIFSVLTGLSQIIMTLLTLYEFATTSQPFAVSSYIIFNFNGVVSYFLMMRLAKSWPVLMKEIADMEKDNLNELLEDKHVMTKTAGLGILMMFLTLVEYLLFCIYIIDFAIRCYMEDLSSYRVWHLFLTFQFTYIPENLLNTIFLGSFLQITTIQAELMWIFLDVVVIIISVYLSIVLKNFNRVIAIQKNDKTTDWALLRLRHTHIVALVKKFDASFNFFVLQSLFNNLFYACLQLFISIRTIESHVNECDQDSLGEALDSVYRSLYYGFSFAFLFLRTSLVMVLAANVNSYACEPVSALGEIHHTAYNIEIQRFYRQLTYTTIGLSGVFFYVTREMILKVLGTLVTYELMLLQLKPENSSIIYGPDNHEYQTSE